LDQATIMTDISSMQHLAAHYHIVRQRLMALPPKLGEHECLWQSPTLIEWTAAPKSVEEKAAFVLKLLPQKRGLSRVPSLLNIVAAVFDIDAGDIRLRTQRPKLAHPRQLAMAICVEIFGWSFSETGRRFGGYHHTTVMQACRKFSPLIAPPTGPLGPQSQDVTL
jgi:Bacterial dnaA protein helix-turn-helix